MTANIRMIVLVLLAVVAACGIAVAQTERSPYDEDVLREARRVYDQIMSPYCPGQTLSNCGSSQADILRDQIRQRIAAGESAESIVQSLVDEFGDDVRAEPPKSGFASLVWLGPIVLLIGGAVVVVFYVRRNTTKRQDGEEDGGDPRVRSRVEEELKTLRD